MPLQLIAARYILDPKGGVTAVLFSRDRALSFEKSYDLPTRTLGVQLPGSGAVLDFRLRLKVKQCYVVPRIRFSRENKGMLGARFIPKVHIILADLPHSTVVP